MSDIDTDQLQGNISIEKMLVELDGCEIRRPRFVPIENSTETTPAYNNPKKEKIINWCDVRLGFVRPLASKSKTFGGKHQGKISGASKIITNGAYRMYRNS